MTKIKICGITDIKTALHVARSGADYIGFVFAKSRRQIDPIGARSIIKALPKSIQSVGVFVDMPPDQVQEIQRLCQLDIIQLHGKENPSDYAHIDAEIIKAKAVKDHDSIAEIPQLTGEYLLLDTYHPTEAGGTGQAFDWDLLRSTTMNRPYFLAGGLRPDNVGAAIRKLTPYAVDVSSGVETNGKKDLDKIKSFVEAVRRPVI